VAHQQAPLCGRANLKVFPRGQVPLEARWTVSILKVLAQIPVTSRRVQQERQNIITLSVAIPNRPVRMAAPNGEPLIDAKATTAADRFLIISDHSGGQNRIDQVQSLSVQ
jgi:hypothetical protein